MTAILKTETWQLLEPNNLSFQQLKNNLLVFNSLQESKGLAPGQKIE